MSVNKNVTTPDGVETGGTDTPLTLIFRIAGGDTPLFEFCSGLVDLVERRRWLESGSRPSYFRQLPASIGSVTPVM